MASFFQPGSNDPAIADCEPSRFQIYCNSILSTDELLEAWYQKLNLIVGLVALVVPVTYLLWHLVVSHLKWRPKRRVASRKQRGQGKTGREKAPSPMPAFKAAKSFRIFEESDGLSDHGFRGNHDLLVLPIAITTEVDGDTVSRSSHVPQTDTPAKMKIACVDIESLNANALNEQQLSETADHLADIFTRSSLEGLALRSSTRRWPDQLNELLDFLLYKDVSVILMGHHDSEVWSSVSLSQVAGVIVENACILPTGERRDYFRSRTLREIMARSSKERETRSEFFVGFLDLWDIRPHPAVIRRAVKLAEHFGAVMEHGSVKSGMPIGSTMQSASQTISGFEYLRRVELIDLQKAWTTEVKSVWISTNSQQPTISPLPVASLENFVPGVSRLLRCEELSPPLRSIQDEQPRIRASPNYAGLAPSRADYWSVSNLGQQISAKGCFPINVEPNDVQYNAVVRTQDHLKVLQMLQPLKGLEHYRLLESLHRLVSAAEPHDLVHSLIEGLETQQICIYKGLDTGFGVSEGTTYFWGVSQSREEDISSLATDIFISLKAPHDATTILHTWLAHNGVPRINRFEIEHDFELANGADEGFRLPTSIKVAVERSSHTENLGLLQQIQVSHFNHPFDEPIGHLCRTTLIEDTSRTYSSHFQAQKALDGSVEVRDILQKRLEYYALKGAVATPSLDNVLKLFELVQATVEEALFSGSRDPLNAMTRALTQVWNPENEILDAAYVDMNADIFALIFFIVLRRAAFEDVYIEATDRCPFFLSQPDQAAVFSELWVLGSQCEIYFGLLPRALGEIVYNRYQVFLKESPPGVRDRKGNEIMSMYSNLEVGPISLKNSTIQRDASTTTRLTSRERMQIWKKRFTELGAMSIFCLPAIMDVLLLTFVGRGVFMTAFMDPRHLQAAGLALLIALLLTAGVTGWVGSVGNYYLVNYAYDNMIYFHVQRLSGGFVLTLVIALAGLVGFSIQVSVGVGFIFVAYLIAIATYFNLLGVMATMHQHKSPITSGRTVLWRTIPLLLLSPLLSSFVNGHDLEIYLPVIYAFLLLTLFQYRRLCREWSTWTTKIPSLSEMDVGEWYSSRKDAISSDSDGDAEDNQTKNAQHVFRQAVEAYGRGVRSKSDRLVASVADGMPYVDWLLHKACPDGKIPETFSASWFTQLGEALKSQRQLARGLKEHNILMLFRFARYDIGQNLGLFLIALMDRWVSIVMGGRLPRPSIYIDSRSRYGICLAILYFCFSVMLLDATLQKYWEVRYKLSDEKLCNFEHAQNVRKQWEVRRIKTLAKALGELFSKIMFVFGGTTMILWILVDTPETMILYYCYILGYTCVIVFQFNRCFTTNTRIHIIIILMSALIGFLVGCALRAIPATAGWLYCEIIAQNIAGLLAAGGTLLWAWKDWTSPTPPAAALGMQKDEQQVVAQRKINAKDGADARLSCEKLRSIRGATVVSEDGSFVAREVSSLLRNSFSSPNVYSTRQPWSDDLIQTAIEQWETRRISVTVASREEFLQVGLEDIWSLSQHVGDMLEISVGYLANEELRRHSWQPQLATLVAEAVLYHVARMQKRMSHAKALQSEHFLSETVTLSRRLEFELSFADESCLAHIRHKTTGELMKHLCFGMAVDAKWDTTPQSVRKAIVNRIAEAPVTLTQELQQWAEMSDADISTSDFNANLCLLIFHKCSERRTALTSFPKHENPVANTSPAALKPVRLNRSRASGSTLRRWFAMPAALCTTFVKWTAVISGAGSDIERELWFCLKSNYLRKPIIRLLLGIWKACWLIKNLWLYAMLIQSRPTMVKVARLAEKGTRRKISGTIVIVELPRKTITGFAGIGDDGSLILEVFEGALDTKPTGRGPLFTAVYDEYLRLKSRIDDSIVSNYNFPPSGRHRWPLSKEVAKDDVRIVGLYDKYGRVTRGTLTIQEKEFAFQYHYKATPEGCSDVLAADFKMIDPQSDDVLSVFWGVPLNDTFDGYDWIPSDSICRLVKTIDDRTYVTDVEYQHRRDPLITNFLQDVDGRKTAIAQVPKVFQEESIFLARPNNVSFDLDDLLVHHSKLQVRQMRRHTRKKPSILSHLNPLRWAAWSGNRVYQPVPTWRIRTELWNDWLRSDDLDAPTACWIDELVLREEPILRAYWRARDSGRLREAKRVLDRDIDQIVAAIDIQTDVSEVCLLPIRAADLYAMGLGKDATQVTTRPQDCFNDTNERISVIFNDIGCWPEAPGGVSNCRRDLVNGHSTIRNHVLAECANDFGIPRFQVEKNVNSIKLLPLWGLDRKCAQHGLIDNLLQSQVDDKVEDTDVQRDIVGVFIPLIKEFVKGARTRRYTRADLIRYSNTMLSMSKYYEQKDYTRTWESREVEEAWVDAWLMPYDDDNVLDPSKCFEIERPSMSDFREALGIYLAYFFIFSVQIPERCPRVFQSTHHGISSLFGMILRYRRGATFGIWDHAILWRECCLNISPAQCELPISVQSMLLSGIGLATRLAYFHADVIMPCTSLFNPMWEAEIGTDKGNLGSKSVFNRRIDPIVNGISNMESFTPVDKVRTEKPTVVMLSNVQFIKGIKTAILAAEIIVNRWGFKDYQLVVYGAKDRQPSYALEMAKLIVENNLSNHVILAGFGKPKEVLKDAWLFMNSSISEGLPLAIGEAALAGVPIVATEVGATALVLTDPEDADQRYGEVVPPNDPLAIARAQLSILSMTGPWAKYTEEVDFDGGPSATSSILPDVITPSDVDWITQRMYEKSEDRRKLGLLSREVVLHSFHGNRYLREHEQMYWIQWHLSHMREDPELVAAASNTYKFGAEPPLRYVDEDDEVQHGEEEEETAPLLSREKDNDIEMYKWQDFEGEEDEDKGVKLPPKRLSKTKRPSTEGGVV